MEASCAAHRASVPSCTSKECTDFTLHRCGGLAGLKLMPSLAAQCIWLTAGSLVFKGADDS